jgi:hypothetical protein
MGASDFTGAATSNSGPIVAASLTDASNASELQSVARGTATNVNISVSVLGFQNSSKITDPSIHLTLGSNQADGALACGGSNGSPQFQNALAYGCPTVYQTTTGSCPNADNPPSCAKQNPGGGKLMKDLASGMNLRVYGDKNANKCGIPNANYNYWASPNTVDMVVKQSPRDPRLVTLIITDYSRGFAYTGDEDPGSANTGVLVGHFVGYVVPDPNAIGSGQCTQNTFGNCVAVLTK